MIFYVLGITCSSIDAVLLISINFEMDFGFIVDGSDTFSICARNLHKSQKNIVFNMNLQVFTHQKNMIFDDLHNCCSLPAAALIFDDFGHYFCIISD